MNFHSDNQMNSKMRAGLWLATLFFAAVVLVVSLTSKTGHAFQPVHNHDISGPCQGSLKVALTLYHETKTLPDGSVVTVLNHVKITLAGKVIVDQDFDATFSGTYTPGSYPASFTVEVTDHVYVQYSFSQSGVLDKCPVPSTTAPTSTNATSSSAASTTQSPTSTRPSESSTTSVTTTAPTSTTNQTVAPSTTVGVPQTSDQANTTTASPTTTRSQSTSPVPVVPPVTTVAPVPVVLPATR